MYSGTLSGFIVSSILLTSGPGTRYIATIYKVHVHKRRRASTTGPQGAGDPGSPTRYSVHAGRVPMLPTAQLHREFLQKAAHVSFQREPQSGQARAHTVLRSSNRAPSTIVNRPPNPHRILTLEGGIFPRPAPSGAQNPERTAVFVSSPFWVSRLLRQLAMVMEVDAQRQRCWSTQTQLEMTSECQNVSTRRGDVGLTRTETNPWGLFEREWDKPTKIVNKIKGGPTKYLLWKPKISDARGQEEARLSNRFTTILDPVSAKNQIILQR
ncbi:hypothetical protein B0H13DRAFT_1873349 [Mycena leptocephala]|nr:hypothetical protein B0H13DRAFT_1873349 [Mycena leptocephala]